MGFQPDTKYHFPDDMAEIEHTHNEEYLKHHEVIQEQIDRLCAKNEEMKKVAWPDLNLIILPCFNQLEWGKIFLWKLLFERKKVYLCRRKKLFVDQSDAEQSKKHVTKSLLFWMLYAKKIWKFL